MKPQTTVTAPNTIADSTRKRCSGRWLRRVDSSAPVSEPTAKQVESRP